MQLLMFSEIGWDQSYLCTNCKRSQTKYGCHACSFRCELKPICAPCNDQLTQVKPEKEEETIVVDESPNTFPLIHEDEELVGLRLMLVYKIPQTEYLDDPWRVECELVNDLCAKFKLVQAQVGVLNCAEHLNVEVVIFSEAFVTEELEEMIPPVRRLRPPGGEAFAPRGDLAKLMNEMRHTVQNFGLNRAQKIELLDVVTISKYRDETQLPLQDAADVATRKSTCVNCGLQVVDWELGEHKRKECMKRPVECELGCGWRLLADELEDHRYYKCPKRTVVCPECREPLQAEALQEHQANSCMQRNVTCVCGSVMRFADLEQHQAEECQCRSIECNWCGAATQPQSLRQHKAVCPLARPMAEELRAACWKLQADEVRRLVLDLTPLEDKDREHGYTALHVAACVGDPAVVDVLLGARAVVDSQDHQQQTPLMRAAARGSFEVAHALLLARADPQAVDAQGLTALAVGTFSRQNRIQSLLMRYGADNDWDGGDTGKILRDEFEVERATLGGGEHYETEMAKIRAMFAPVEASPPHKKPLAVPTSPSAASEPGLSF